MYINFVAHNTSNSSSSFNLFQYLEKENEEAKLKNQVLAFEENERGLQIVEERFFNQDFDIKNQLEDPNGKITLSKAVEEIDKNRGTQNLSSSNFYMVNVSPSEEELKHMSNIAREELERRGLFYEDCKENEVTLSYYEEQKDQLIKAQMKIYTQELMNEYARSMNREIYVYQDALPSNEERKQMKPEIERRYELFLKEKGLLEEQKEGDMIEVSYERKIASTIEGGNAYVFQYSGKEYVIFATEDKAKELDNHRLLIDKEYYEEKSQEGKDKINGVYNADEKLILKVRIDKQVGNSTSVILKPEGYNAEVKLWINNKDFKSLGNGVIEMNKYRAEKLVVKAIERDKEQKQKIKIDCIQFKEKELKGDKLITFSRNEKGLLQPVTFTFKESELEKKEGVYYVEKYKLDYRVGKAKTNAINIEFGEVKEDIKHQVWEENGFKTEKRAVEGKDLLYFAKVERERTYKHTDKSVIKNKPILTEIKRLEQMGLSDVTPINQLKKELLRDKYTGEVIKEGVKKGGLNYHIHIIVSRHDRTSINPRDKVSMSPLANHKEGKMNNGAKVGFDRDKFFQKSEQIFDNKFEYQRPLQERYIYRNEKGKELRGRATGLLKTGLKKEVMKHTGMGEVKQELDIRQKVKKEIMPIPIPTSLPSSKIDLVFKLARTIKNIVDKGIEY